MYRLSPLYCYLDVELPPLALLVPLVPTLAFFSAKLPPTTFWGFCYMLCEFVLFDLTPIFLFAGYTILTLSAPPPAMVLKFLIVSAGKVIF